MGGWRTKVGMVILSLGGILKALSKAGVEPEITEPLGEALIALGGSFTAYGLGRKIERTR